MPNWPMFNKHPMKWQKTVPPRPSQAKIEEDIEEEEGEGEKEDEAEETEQETELEGIDSVSTSETTTASAKKLRNRIQNDSTHDDMKDLRDVDNTSLKKGQEKPGLKPTRESVEEKVE